MGPDEAGGLRNGNLGHGDCVVCLKGLCCSSKENVEGDGGLGAFSLVAMTCRDDSSRKERFTQLMGLGFALLTRVKAGATLLRFVFETISISIKVRVCCSV